jgi:hypothetical protein
MVVQHSEHEFTLSFFALEKPIILGSPEERQKAVENITSARAKCVAQVIVSPERMKDFVSVLDANYQIYKDKVK